MSVIFHPRFLVLCFILALMFFVMGIFQEYHYSDGLINNGVITSGVIFDRECISHRPPGRHDYHAKARYTDEEGNSHVIYLATSDTDYAYHSVVTIVYDSDKPDHAKVIKLDNHDVNMGDGHHIGEWTIGMALFIWSICIHIFRKWPASDKNNRND
ncbi:DUF3592 domain-containing protein [Escherichia sp. B1147]|uniref:DUF3592 domain-containing protein n=1 Tax=Escherichia sp. B1147 TaxID=754307 RepID=UPI0009451080|nr:DUF3592 domain-containing protein [Escherichia sp. B1147]